jgi:outer membrane lipoprotein-sorting protein
VGELGDVLELLHGAPGEYRTVRAVLRQWWHHERQRRAWERHATRHQAAGARSWTLYGDVRGEAPEESQSLIRVWLEPPARAREEREDAEGTTFSVRVGGTWWLYSPSMGALSNEGDPGHETSVGDALEELLHPMALLAGCELDLAGEAEQAGRPALRLRARPRPAPRWLVRDLLGFADEHEVLVDRERGLLLRRALLLDGEELSVTEVQEIAFDETFPPETFVFVPPEGETMRSSLDARHRHVTLEEAAREAPFTVWVPARVPEGFRLAHVLVAGERERATIQASVLLAYMPAAGTHQLSLHETKGGSAAPSVWAPSAEPQLVERGGRTLRVLERGDEQPWRENQVSLELEGTAITLTSDLDLETLLELVDALVPAPTEPPRLRPRET